MPVWRTLARHTFTPGAALAIVLGLAASALHREAIGLAPPAACPGLLETAAAYTAQIAPRAPLGAWLLRADVLLLAPAVALVVVLLRSWSASVAIASSVGVAIVVQRLLDPVISPFDPVVIIAAAATFLALEAGHPRGVLAGIVLTALVSPRATLPLMVLAALASFRPLTLSPSHPLTVSPASRWRQVALASAIVGLPTSALALVMPPLPPQVAASAGLSSCALPLSGRADLNAWAVGFGAVFGSAGAFALGLAVLGAFSAGFGAPTGSPRRTRALLWVWLGYAILPTLGAEAGQSLLRNFGTLLVAFWALAASGLKVMVDACRRGVGGRIAATAFVILLPLFQFIAAQKPSPPVQTFGLDRASAHDFRQLLAVLPDRSVLVEEEASVASLLRALNRSRRRMGKRLELARPDPEALSRLPPDVRVFALPRSQSRLQWLGVRLSDSDLPGISGVADLKAGAACQRVSARWLDVPSIPASMAPAFSVVSSDIDAEHAVLVYAVTDAEPHPAELFAEGSERSGFRADIYRQDSAEGRTRLESVTREDQLVPEIANLQAPFVARMEFWRSTMLPKVVAVSLGVRPRHVLVRGTSGQSAEQVCPVFPYGARDLQFWQ